LNRSVSSEKLPTCEYDQKCYRFKPEHRAACAHPIRDAYHAYCKTYMESGFVSEKQKKELSEFRISKGISLEAHNGVIQALNWTLQEFENGRREEKSNKRKREDS